MNIFSILCIEIHPVQELLGYILAFPPIHICYVHASIEGTHCWFHVELLDSFITEVDKAVVIILKPEKE